mgnify:FL=1
MGNEIKKKDGKLVTKPIEKKPIAETRKELQILREKYEKILSGAYCHMCDSFKSKDKFYATYDPLIRSGCTNICKQCATDVALRRDMYGNYHEATKDSVKAALKYLNKPFLDSVWDSSVAAVADPSNSYKDVWSPYITTISAPQYRGMTWENSDIFDGKFNPKYKYPDELEAEYKETNAANEEYQTNRTNVVSLIGYDPFINYPREIDKPMLYASLAAFIDEEAVQDPMKMKAVIQIVKSLNQVEKINEQMDILINQDVTQQGVIAAMDDLTASIQKLMGVVNTLAKENGISVNSNKQKTKGASTLSGKIKYLEGIGFRNSKINTFDYGTCMGMRQVAEISEEARHKQINIIVCVQSNLYEK